MDAKAIYVMDVWFSVGKTLPFKLTPPTYSGGAKITEIIVDMSDPRNFSGVPANVYIVLTDDTQIEIQARDVVAFK